MYFSSYIEGFLRITACSYTLAYLAAALLLHRFKRIQLKEVRRALLALSVLPLLDNLLVLAKANYAIKAFLIFFYTVILLIYFLHHLKIRERTVFSLTLILLGLSLLNKHGNAFIPGIELIICLYLFYSIYSEILGPKITLRVCTGYAILTVVAATVMVKIYADYTEKVLMQNRSELKELAYSLSFRIEHYKRILKLSLFIPEVKEALLSEKPKVYLMEKLAYITEAKYVYIVNRKGIVIACSQPRFIGTDVSFRPYYRKAINGSTAVYIAKGVRSNVLGIFFGFPIWHKGRVIGVLAYKFELPPFLDLKLFSRRLLLIHKSGLVIEGPKELRGYCICCNEKLLAQALRERILGKDTYKGKLNLQAGNRILINGNKFILLKVNIPGSDFLLALLLPWKSPLTQKKLPLMLWFLMNLLLSVPLIELTELSILMTTDFLTGVLNRRTLFSRLYELLIFCCRNKEFTHIIIIDLDDFKRINDTYGHQVGDTVLKTAVQRIRYSLRPYDIMGRYGGEEFVVAFCSKNPDDGGKVAERLRQALSSEPIPVGNTFTKITASFGVATVNTKEHQCDEKMRKVLEKAIAKADEALYLAKKHGKNRTVVHYMV